MTSKNLLAVYMIFAFALFSFADPTELTQGLKWRVVGPLRAGWSSCAEGISEEPGTFYFGAVDGGVWKTIDNGITWNPIADHAPFSSVGTMAIAHTNPRAIYVGTGHVDTRYDVMNGTGVYKTTDDGKTWISLGLNDTQHVGRILVNSRNPNIVLVAALGHLFGPNAERGVFRSEDGGSNWKNVLFVDENTGAVDLASDAATPDVVYAAFWQVRQYPWLSYFQPEAGAGSGIWKSTDGGKTWHQTSRNGLPKENLSRIGLAVAPGTNGQRVYASVALAEEGGFYRSDDGGNSWRLMNQDGELYSTYFGKVTADPRNRDGVYVMGRSVHYSRDGGKTFTITKGTPGGDDYHFMWIDPQHPERQILASDQGTTVTANNGATWSPWYNQATGQFYHLATDQKFPYWIYSGQQDSGTVAVASRSDYGQLTFRDWHPVGGDERDYDIPDPDDPNIVYASGLGGRLSRWDAGTGRVSNVTPTPRNVYGKRPTTIRYRYTWITPIAISPQKPRALYQGAQMLFRSMNKGQSWQVVSPDLSGADPKMKDCGGKVPVGKATACGYGVIFSIAPSPATDGVLWIGTDNGRVHLTRDNAKTWNDVTPKEVADWSKIASIDASAKDAGTAYIAVDRHRVDDRRPYIYRTHDYGKTWTSIAAGIPLDAWVNAVRQDPEQPNLLFAGTRNGVFYSLDDGDQWQPLQLNLARTGVNDLLIHENDLIAATQGRSIWILDHFSPLRYLKSTQSVQSVTLTPPAAAIRLSANENRDTPLPPEFPTTSNPPSGAIIDYFLPDSVNSPVTIEISDAAGKALRTFRSDQKPELPDAERYFAEFWVRPRALPTTHAGHNRFVWNLRMERPKSADYDFSIAAVPGQDTPVVPQGMLILPGKYTVKLSVAGQSTTQPLIVQMDPRSTKKPADLIANEQLYEQVKETLAAAANRLKSVKAADKKRKEKKPQGAEEEAQTKIMAQLLDKESENSLSSIEGALNALLIDLEESDGPPTAQQRELYLELKTKLQGLPQL